MSGLHRRAEVDVEGTYRARRSRGLSVDRDGEDGSTEDGEEVSGEHRCVLVCRDESEGELIGEAFEARSLVALYFSAAGSSGLAILGRIPRI